MFRSRCPAFAHTLLRFIILLSRLHYVLLANEKPPFGMLPDVSTRFQPLAFDEAYSVTWGNPTISEDGLSVDLTLDKSSGSGFMSLGNYMYGLYSASIKLPANYTAGIVLAFYASNEGDFPHNHDELDFELLGNNVKGKPWRIQTNIYGNGSVARGREERLDFWFDPSAAFHNYSIVWNPKHVVFMVDEIPIREMVKTEHVTVDYPSKPMALYTTIWDASSWATDGGKYPVDYAYAPFKATVRNLKLEGCEINPVPEEYDPDACALTIETVALESLLDKAANQHNNKHPTAKPAVPSSELFALTPSQRAAMDWVRANHMFYSYCDDRARYKDPLPECAYNPISSISHSRKRKTRRPKRSISRDASSHHP